MMAFDELEIYPKYYFKYMIWDEPGLHEFGPYDSYQEAEEALRSAQLEIGRALEEMRD